MWTYHLVALVAYGFRLYLLVAASFRDPENPTGNMSEAVGVVAITMVFTIGLVVWGAMVTETGSDNSRYCGKLVLWIFAQVAFVFNCVSGGFTVLILMYALATRPRELLGESWEKVVMVVGSVFMGVAILTWLAG